MEKIRGKQIAMIFQEPMTALNPVMTIGKQIGECLKLHHPEMKEDEIRKQVCEALNDVGIANPETRFNQYSHEFSVCMRQRVMIAMAMSSNPKVLIADEPTTALDVTIQAQILKLMNELKAETGTAIMFITHDLGVINQMADDVAGMYCGQVVETAPVDNIFMDSEYIHPYTADIHSAFEYQAW